MRPPMSRYSTVAASAVADRFQVNTGTARSPRTPATSPTLTESTPAGSIGLPGDWWDDPPRVRRTRGSRRARCRHGPRMASRRRRPPPSAWLHGQDRVHLPGQSPLGLGQPGVVRVCDREPDAIEAEYADVGPAVVVHRFVRNPCCERERRLEVAERQLADEREAGAAPARVDGLAPSPRREACLCISHSPDRTRPSSFKGKLIHREMARREITGCGGTGAT